MEPQQFWTRKNTIPAPSHSTVAPFALQRLADSSPTALVQTWCIRQATVAAKALRRHEVGGPQVETNINDLGACVAGMVLGMAPVHNREAIAIK